MINENKINYQMSLHILMMLKDSVNKCSQKPSEFLKAVAFC
ncbi:hypothetical protein [Desulfosporosinus nitroreducens]|nr:hypothetical protein [Desulfosporosinus nitroreducens]